MALLWFSGVSRRGPVVGFASVSDSLSVWVGVQGVGVRDQSGVVGSSGTVGVAGWCGGAGCGCCGDCERALFCALFCARGLLALLFGEVVVGVCGRVGGGGGVEGCGFLVVPVVSTFPP